MRGAHEMKRHIRLIADDPTVVIGRPRWNVKERTGAEFMDRAVVHRSSGTAGKHQPNMLAVAARCTNARSNMSGPPPPRLVRGATDCHVPDPDDIESSFFERPYFVRLFKSLQNHFEHCVILRTGSVVSRDSRPVLSGADSVLAGRKSSMPAKAVREMTLVWIPYRQSRINHTHS
jgi:hypothetical protein